MEGKPQKPKKQNKTAIHVKYIHSTLASNGYILILPLKVRLFLHYWGQNFILKISLSGRNLICV